MRKCFSLKEVLVRQLITKKRNILYKLICTCQAIMEPENHSKQYEESDGQESFSSISSGDQQPIQQKTNKYSFTFHHNYKQRAIPLPQIPSNLPKLYQIYQQNENRKKQLKKAIQELADRQLKIIRINYDEEILAIEEYIDTDQISEEYLFSKNKYEKRQKQLIDSVKQYESLKIQQMESIIQNTNEMRELLTRYCQENKEIIEYCVNEDQVHVLCRQKKISHVKAPKLNIKKELSHNDSESVAGSHISEDAHVSYKYLVRIFKFYSAQTENNNQQQKIAFHPMQKPLQLPKINQQTSEDPIEYKKIAYHAKYGIMAVCDEKIVYILKNSKILHYQHIENSRIIFNEIRENRLYVGTADGVIRIFKIEEESYELLLEKMMGCYLDQYSEITHYSLTQTPDIVLFVESGHKLCMANLSTFSNYLLVQVPEQIQKLTHNFIITKKDIYPNYAIMQGAQLTANLKPSQYLQQYKQSLIAITRINNKQYCICDMKNGQFIVKQYKGA